MSPFISLAYIQVNQILGWVDSYAVDWQSQLDQSLREEIITFKYYNLSFPFINK